MVELSNLSFWGLPMMMWGGLLTFGLAFLTGLVGYLINKGKFGKLNVHKGLAGATIIVGLLHAVFSMIVFFSK